MTMFRSASAALTCFGAIALCGCSHNTSGDTQSPAVNATDAVATVNGDPITRAEFDRQLENFTPNPQQPQSGPTGSAVLERMISNRLLVQYAKKQGAAPTDTEINDEYQTVELQNALNQVKPLDDALNDAGLTAEQYKESTITPLLSELNLLTKGTTVSDADIQKYYNDKKATEFSRPERAHIRRIVVQAKSQADDIFGQVNKGTKPFEAFVSQSLLHDSPTGDLPTWVPLDPAKAGELAILVKAIAPTQPGKTAPPFTFRNVWWLIKVVDKKPAEVVPFDKAKAAIRMVLLEQKAQANPGLVQATKEGLRDFQTHSAITVAEKRYEPVVESLLHPAPVAAPQAFPQGGIQVQPQPAPKAH